MAKNENGKKGAAKKAVDHAVVMLEVKPRGCGRTLVSLDLDDLDDRLRIKVGAFLCGPRGTVRCRANLGVGGGEVCRVTRAYKVVPIGECSFGGRFPTAVEIALCDLYKIVKAKRGKAA